MSEHGPAYPFALDAFQHDAIAALDAGRHVVVAAPTGSGKTVVAEHGIERARASGKRAFYTAPLKALSNQKFADFRVRYAPQRVGLLTGDNAVDGDADIVVMTTEVLRNMIYARSPALADLGVVVLDEVHFLQDTYRGPVWEEVIIHLSATVQLVCLSATVSNSAELAEWIETVRGPTSAVVETKRPIALVDHYLVGDRTNDRLHFLPTFVDGSPNPAAMRLDGSAIPRGRSRRHGDDRGPVRGSGRRLLYTPSRSETVGVLDEHRLLPAIYFIFSRNQCEEAARSVAAAGVRMTTGAEREHIRQIVDDRLSGFSDADLAVLGYGELLAQLEAGAAPHHAGMVPAFKEVVERCFVAGLLKVVFATETLAVGVNMPARTVVIEKLTKFTGDHHEMLTAGEYTQLTGRAGRRGLDVAGQAVVLWSPFVGFERVAALAGSRTFHLRSAFRPTYNMAANLVRTHSPDGARQLLNLSFAQFQADRDVVALQARAERLRVRVADARERAVSPHGDIWAYRAERQALDDRRADGAGLARREIALGRLRPGDVVMIHRGRYEGPAAMVASARRKGGMQLTVVTEHAEVTQVGVDDIIGQVAAVGKVRLPGPYGGKDKAYRRAVARALTSTSLRRSPGRKSRRPPSIHPVEYDPDLGDRMKAAGQAERLQRDLDDVVARIGDHHRTLGTEFEAVIDVLERRGYVAVGADDWSITEKGRRLTRIFHESDLLVAEVLDAGVFVSDAASAAAGAEAAIVAGLLSTLVYEHRSPEPAPPPWFPSAAVRKRWHRLQAISEDLAADERSLGLSVHRSPDPGFFAAAHGWIAGHDLDAVVDDDLTGGDFVRTMKQLIDLARQVAEIAPDAATRAAAAEIVERGRRGVVADGGLGIEIAAALDEGS